MEAKKRYPSEGPVWRLEEWYNGWSVPVPTGRLRLFGQKKVLQHEWRDADGYFEWRDVPHVLKD